MSNYFQPITQQTNNFLQTALNFNLGMIQFTANAFTSYENIIKFRAKFLANLNKKILTGKIKPQEVTKLLEFALQKELEMLRIDDSALSQILVDYRGRFIDSAINVLGGDHKAILRFAKNFAEEQFLAEKGQKRIRENIRREYGLDVSSETIYETNCLRLLRIIPVYQEGENKETYRYTQQPVVWFPPTVLDHHIISLLPNHGMSLVHHLAKFHPTYVIILKDYKSINILEMDKNQLILEFIEIFQFMNLITAEKPIFSGYCQGGTIAILASLTSQLRPYIKAVFATTSPTGKKENEDIGPMAMVFEELELVGEIVNGQLMIGKEFLSIGLKKSGWSSGSDLLSKMLIGKKNRERIKKEISQGLSPKEAEKAISQESIKELAVEMWLESMRSVPWATTEMTLPIFKDGILSDGTYNLHLLGETIDTKNFNRRKLPLRLFFGKYDKVVPPESAQAIATYVNDCKFYEFPGGHIDMCTKFHKGFQEHIVKEVEAIATL